jgi:hypothetical protein
MIIDILRNYSEIVDLGKDCLQKLCNEWVCSPDAKEMAVSSIVIGDNNNPFSINPNFVFTHNVQEGEYLYFPVDNLLYYIVDRSGFSTEIIKNLKNRIEHARSRAPNVYKRFKIRLGPKKDLFITCKNQNCKNIMMTQHKAYQCETVTFEPSTVTCTKCGKIFEYYSADFHFMPGY